MKKHFTLLLLAAFAFVSTSYADEALPGPGVWADDGNSIYVEDFDIQPGEEKEIQVFMKNTKLCIMSQYRIQFPKGISILYDGTIGVDADFYCDKAARINTTRAQKNNVSAGCNLIDATNNIYQFLIYSGNNTVFSDYEGALVTLTIKADDDFVSGSGSVFQVLINYDGEPGVSYWCHSTTFNVNGSSTQKGSLSISSVGVGTFFTDKAFVMPTGVTGSVIDAATKGVANELTYYNAGDVVPASTGIIVRGAEGTYEFDYSTEAGTAPTTNLLRGSVDAETTTGGDVFYKLSLNSAGDAGSLGFYWVNDGGAAFINAAGKAYLALTNEQAAGIRSFVIGNPATAITSVTTTASDGAYFDLQGRRATGKLSGIYVQNGKKVLVK